MKAASIIPLLLPLLLWSHGGVDHSKPVQKQPSKQETTKATYTQINQAYVQKVKPILATKCFACHAAKPKNMPWYYSIPGAKQLIDYDMTEAKKHIDLRKDFPFVSHSTPTKDLKSLKESVEENSMPPFQYKLLHWNSSLSTAEKKVVLKWIDKSLKLLEKENKPE